MELIVIGIVALLAGLAIGWLLGGRGTSAVRAEHAASVAQGEMLRALRETLEAERDNAVGECGSLRIKIADLTARSEEQAAAQARLLAELKDVRESLPIQFKAIAQTTLDAAQTKFLERADERFKQSEETTKLGVTALIRPVQDTLKRYEESVTKVEAERRDAFGVLQGQIEAMRTGTERVSAEAANLVNALRNAPKARGRWGEQQLKNVLESCGLAEHTDFKTEVSVEHDGGRLRPDAVVNIPGGKALVIDAKVSLNAYQDAFNAVDDDARKLGLAAHATSMRNHVNALGNKAYWNQFEDAPDYVIMFVPGEHFLSAALEHDPGLWDFAFERRVLLATPTNLVAIARTVAAVWRQEKLAKEARQIGLLGKELYERLSVVGEHLASTGTHLNRAVGSFNKATNSYNTRLLSTGKRFRDLNVDTGGRDLDDLSGVEALASHVAVDNVIALPEPKDVAAG
ncbi:DNA recombination RmuC-like protein [Sphingomonas antarctica]